MPRLARSVRKARHRALDLVQAKTQPTEDLRGVRAVLKKLFRCHSPVQPTCSQIGGFLQATADARGISDPAYAPVDKQLWTKVDEQGLGAEPSENQGVGSSILPWATIFSGTLLIEPIALQPRGTPGASRCE